MTAVYSNGYATEDVDKGRYYTKERELFPIPQNDIDLSRGALVQIPDIKSSFFRESKYLIIKKVDNCI